MKFVKRFMFLIILFYELGDELIIVHVVPHSHDDPGWLNTYDECYYGIQSWRLTCVRCIYDSVLESLLNDEKRTFVAVEITYFSKWYNSISDERKKNVKTLIESGRWEFANAGWVMHDEATTHYQHIIDNMRLGLQFIKSEFNQTVTTAWFIDTFGHSSANAAILSKLGYENLVIVRADFSQKNQMRKEKKMEFHWKPFFDIDNGTSSIFTHVIYNHYNPNDVFPGFINDVDFPMNNANISNRVDNIINWAKRQRSAYLTNNILLLYGEDFSFTMPNLNFLNIERIMDYFNNNTKVSNKIKFIYSTPTKYFNALKSYNNEFPELKNYDFFPYADNPNAYWTGYFTSRPYLKGLVREAGKMYSCASRLVFEKNLRRYQINNSYLE